MVNEPPDRAKRIQLLLDECLRRRAGGEGLPDEAIIADHPELMPELAERLRALQPIEEAGRQPAVADSSAPARRSYIHGRCPECQSRWRAGIEKAGLQVRCRKCGHVFEAEAEPTGEDESDVPVEVTAQPAEIPGYKIEGELGQGGMGKVYRARQLATKRTVALKVMLAGAHATDNQRRRFAREVEIAASLEHPGIARLYASGLHESHHWFAMEYVAGERLDRYLAEKDLSIRQILELFIPICEAVSYAHQCRVIHRDLKPGNIMVTADGQPQVLDFGLAKALDSPPSHLAEMSLEGQVTGTPAYMSPEQTKGDPAAVDVRSDVYSLGVVLYRVLTGQLPYGDSGTSVPELLRAVSEIDAQPPRQLRPDIPDEVGSILLKALEKDPARRYQNAGELGQDLHRFLSDEPVKARRPSAWYHLRKFAKRNKVLVGGVAAVLVALAVGVVASTILYLKAEDARGEAIHRATIARHRLMIMTARSLAKIRPHEALLILREIPADTHPETATRVLNITHEALRFSPFLTERRLLGHTDTVRHAAWSPDGKRIVTASYDGRARVWDADGTGEPIVLTGHSDKVYHAAWSPDGKRIVTASHDHTARVWNADGTGDPIVLAGHTDKVGSPAWSPDGKRIVTASFDGTARVWSADGTGGPIILAGHTDRVRSAAWSPDGKRIATASYDRTARVWNADGTGDPIVLAGHADRVWVAAWSPDGKRIVTAAWDSKARVWNADGTGKPIILAGKGWNHAAWSPDGKRIVTTSNDDTARVWNADGTGRPILLAGHKGGVWDAAWSPDGKRIVTTSEDHTARVWNAEGTGDPIILTGHGARVHRAAWSPDGKRIITTADDHTARVWNVDSTGDTTILNGHKAQVIHAAWSPDGKRIATASQDKTARVWNADGAGDPIILAGHTAPVWCTDWSPDGKRIVTTSNDRTARVWNSDGTGEPIVLTGHPDQVRQAAWSPDGKRIVTISKNHPARVWNADGTGEPIMLAGHTGHIWHAAWSPDGKRIVTASWDKTARVWNADGSGEPTVLAGHGAYVFHAAWSPDGKRIVTTSWDYKSRVWNADGTGEPIVLDGHKGIVFRAIWSPDGERIVTTSADYTARVWNADGTGEPIVLTGHADKVCWAAWSPDGRRIATSSLDKTARVWNADGTGDAIIFPWRTNDAYYYLAWSPDGKRIVTAFSDGTAWVWAINGWPEMRASLWKRIQDEFTVEERIRYLSETPEEAEAAVAE